MPTFRALLTLPAIISTTLIAHALARPDGIIGEDRGSPKAVFATSLTGGEGCSPSDLGDIRAGFAEMTTLFAASIPYETSGQPSVEFFGPPAQITNYTDMISENLQRAAQYGTIKDGEGEVNADIHVRCDDPVGACRFGNKREGSHAAYNIGNEPHINFCNDYFKLDPLDKRVNKKANNQMERDRMMEYYNRATLWARMVMHISDVGKAIVQRAIPGGPNSTTEWTMSVTQGAMNTSVLAGVLNERPDTDGPNNFQTLKYAYGVTRAKLLAVLSTQMPYDAANNAENYAFYALARYVMAKKNLYPNVPIMDFPNEATVLTNENLQDGERVKFAYFDMTDVFPLPAGMEPKGGPLPLQSSDSSFHGVSVLQIGWTIVTMATCFAFSSMG